MRRRLSGTGFVPLVSDLIAAKATVGRRALDPTPTPEPRRPANHEPRFAADTATPSVNGGRGGWRPRRPQRAGRARPTAAVVSVALYRLDLRLIGIQTRVPASVRTGRAVHGLVQLEESSAHVRKT